MWKLIFVIIVTLWITYLYVQISEERDLQTIGYSNLLYWHSMASSPQFLCRKRGGEYSEIGFEINFINKTQDTSWKCIHDKK